MNLVFVFKYHDLFDDSRPDLEELLQGIPSGIVIGMMTTINDTLMIRGNTVYSQLFILDTICASLLRTDREQVMSRAKQKFDTGHKLFGFPYTVELMNREFAHFKGNEVQNQEGDASNTLKILKAYLSLVDEMTDREAMLFKNASDNLVSDAPFLQLMWPHLIKQGEFINVPDVFYETQRGLALMEFLATHPKYGKTVTDYFESLNCNSGYEYLTRILAIVIPNFKRENSPKPMDYFFRIRVSEPQPVLQLLTIDPEEIRNNKAKQLDYRGMKERPLFEIIL